MPTDPVRPDPDTLLKQIQAQESHAARGQLRIYFGASAGVGKTFAMLEAARALREQGRDVVVGIAETHGRSDTASLLQNLEILPRKCIVRRDRVLEEFDIDAALARRPSLILVDELAHSNIEGARHPKRWQDVDELLAAGIDVFTTLNVQHLESLNDVVGGITGIRVAETVPDTVFDAADEVILVDIPADELLARLKAGKVYLPAQAERASRNFFRKGNLIALRELALRRTADRVQGDVQAYRAEQSIVQVWKTDPHLLACIGPSKDSEHIVRTASRLAGQLNAQWHAVYVETPALQRLPTAQRTAILKTLKMAEDLGATTAVLAGDEIAGRIASYARAHNIGTLLLGRGRKRLPWRISYAQKIGTKAPDLDIIETGPAPIPKQETSPSRGDTGPRSRAGLPRWRYLWTVLTTLVTILIAAPIAPHFNLANIVMLFLLAVVLSGVLFGRGPAVLAAFLNVAAFDYFFVPPTFDFSVSDLEYLMVFTVMLIVGLISGQLTAGLRFQARIAAEREARTRALYEFARALSGTLQAAQIVELTRTSIQHTFDAHAIVLLPDDRGRLHAPDPQAARPDEIQIIKSLDIGIAQWALDQASPAGIGTNTLPAHPNYYLPLIAPMRTRGILAVKPATSRWLLIPEQRRLLDTFAALAAIALERVHYIEVAQDALLHMESERLRNSLLSALSHDLRTPLTSLIGLSEVLATAQPPLPPELQDTATALHDESLRMSRLVSNLLDMARIQSGQVKLKLQWLPFEEAVGAALQAGRSFLKDHEILTQIPMDLPLVRYDAILMERVLWNLLENAAKYTPSGSRITIAARVDGPNLAVTVADNGPGIPPGQESAIFEKFTRGGHESPTSGVGLGLAICRAIIEAHHGGIHAARSPDGGAAITFTLPLETPPAIPDDDEPERTA